VKLYFFKKIALSLFIGDFRRLSRFALCNKAGGDPEKQFLSFPML